MARQALYRKWRSQTFDEVVGQRHVTRTLKNALRAGRMSHAYLFTGPRGTGKTSTARILAKAVNCQAPLEVRPCNECHMCVSITEGTALDLIEIDAASNTSVDDVRDLREKVNFSPSEGRYKVYIIDEVHMLSNSAFNALLKTLEEPPDHVLFVLATTEVHRVPATVVSRCQRFDFHRIAAEAIVEHLATILDTEGVAYEREALETLAWQATGSMRDAISLLDQLIASGGGELTVTVELAREILGLPDSESVTALVDALLARDTARGLTLINTVLEQGTDARQFLVTVLDHLRALLLVSVGGGEQLRLRRVPAERVKYMQAQLHGLQSDIPAGGMVDAIRAFHGAGADLKLGLQPQLPLELAFVEAVLALGGGDATADGGAGDRSAQGERVPAASPQAHSTSNAQKAPADDEQSEEPPAAVATEPAQPEDDKLIEEHDLEWWQQEWPQFLEWLETHGSKGKRLAIRLKFGQPHALDDETLTLRFDYSIHKEKVEEQETRTVVQRALRAYGGRPLRVACVWMPRHPPHGEDETPAKTKYQKAAEDPIVREALRLGGRIVDVRLGGSNEAGQT